MTLISSWIDTANAEGCPFPVNNLPCGVASRKNESRKRCVVAIGEFALDLTALERGGLLSKILTASVFEDGSWNAFMATGPDVWRRFRGWLQDALSEQGAGRREQLASHLIPLSDVTLHLPFKVAEFTDFYAGLQHAINMGSIWRRTDAPIPANWTHLPIGYNGRASTIVVSGTPITRPLGQLKFPDEELPRFGPSEKLDFELEIGAVIGVPSTMGRPIDPESADERIFGYVLLNDWSARDIQRWEAQPLGPFQGKAFGTSIGPWIVQRDALQPFAKPLPELRNPLLPYLAGVGTLYDIDLEVHLRPAHCREYTRISKTNHSALYYSSAQQLAHHAIGGCAMSVGDLLGSGTISGLTEGEYGSLMELAWNGSRPLSVGGTERSFLQDGDSLSLSGVARGNGFAIGFGSCEGTILPACPSSIGIRIK